MQKIVIQQISNMDRTAAFYASPTYVQSGGGVPIFSGSRRQRGGGILGAIKNFFLPMLQGVKRQAINRAKSEVLGLAKNVAWDAIRGKNVGQSLKTHGLQSVKRIGKNVILDAVSQVKGSASRKRAKQTPKKQQPAAKRARKANF
ncbi:MAG: hypothetical protein AAGK05_00105 [Pseudomonadota bacterium]